MSKRAVNGPLMSKREGQRSITIEQFFPPEGYRYLTDEDEVEAVRRVALSGANVVLSPRLAMEFVCDWRNMRAALSSRIVTSGCEAGVPCPGSGLGPNGASVMKEQEDGWYARCLTCDEVVKLAPDAEGLIALVPHFGSSEQP